MRAPLCLIIVAGLAAAGLMPARAEACSCIQPGYDFIAPVDGARDVPRNTKVWFGAPDGTRGFTVQRVDGDARTEVAGSITEIGAFDSRVVVFTPESPLSPGVTYEASSMWVASTFTVADVMDETPPPFPSIEDREHRVGNGVAGIFGGSGGCDSTDDRLLILDIDSDGDLTVVDVDRTSDLDPAAPSGGVSTFAFYDPVYIGQGGCTFNWTERGRVGVRLGAFDLAGNFSGWSEDSDEDVPIGGCGCSAAEASSGAPLGALVLLGALALRRRRR